MNKRVVITGLGVISSIGIGKEDFWNNLIAGKSGISDVTTFDTSKYDNHKGGEVKDFNPSDFISRKHIAEMGRASQFAVAASQLALDDAKMHTLEAKKARAGVIVGTTMADAQAIEQIDKYWIDKSEDEVWATNIVKYPSNVIADNVGYYLGTQGPNYVLPNACAAGNYSIGYSFDLIRAGKTTIMLAGGSEQFSRITFTGFSRLFAMSPDRCQPFDKNRKGMIVGEGAGILVLEELEHAKRRGATMHAEVLGYGLSCDAHHMTAPSVKGITSVLENAMKFSDIRKNDVEFICTHGTGTPANDRAECHAMKNVFGEKFKELLGKELTKKKKEDKKEEKKEEKAKQSTKQ